MGETALAKQGEQRARIAKSKLTADQIAFATWLALPSLERGPKTQKEFGELIGISEQSLCAWKKIPELREVFDDIVGMQGRELVPNAIRVLRDSMASGDKKVALGAAQDILNRWGEVAKQGHIITSIKEMYEHYH